MSRYDDDFEHGLSQPVYGEPRPSWFKRNWLWFVPTLILLPFFCCCGGGGLFLWWGLSEMKRLPPYVDTVKAAEQDPQVRQALGTPLEVPTVFGMPNGQMDYELNTGSEKFTAEVNLQGQLASGTLRIEAQSTDGINWTYTVREVELPDGTVISLIPPASGPTITPDPDEPSEPPTDPQTEPAPNDEAERERQQDRPAA
ncbi:MAG: cytochrome c oxidase assembly factor Coa1 family protein [Planctomycetota bacterium]